MSNNILNLSSVETKDLVHELYERGYYTDLFYSVHDVDRQLDYINEDRDEDNQIVLSEEQKKEILDESFSLDSYCEQMNNDIQETILNRTSN
jgi:hypothetical protein